MKAKPTIPGAMIRYTTPPFRQLPDEGDEVPTDTYWHRRWLHGEIWRLEGSEWVRRVPSTGEIVRERAESAVTPTGRESLVPMTTR